MTYAALPAAPAGYVSKYRLYDALMARIDLDLVTWNYPSFKMSLLTLSPKEQAEQVATKQASLMRYRKHLVQLEQSLAGAEQAEARTMMQAGGDLDALAQVEQEIQTI